MNSGLHEYLYLSFTWQLLRLGSSRLLYILLIQLLAVYFTLRLQTCSWQAFTFLHFFCKCCSHTLSWLGYSVKYAFTHWTLKEKLALLFSTVHLSHFTFLNFIYTYSGGMEGKKLELWLMVMSGIALRFGLQKTRSQLHSTPFHSPYSSFLWLTTDSTTPPGWKVGVGKNAWIIDDMLLPIYPQFNRLYSFPSPAFSPFSFYLVHSNSNANSLCFTSLRFTLTKLNREK